MSSQPEAPAIAFESRLRELSRKVRDGLPERAAQLRACALRLAAGDGQALPELGRHIHRMAGIVGSHGFARLSALSLRLDEQVHELTREQLVGCAIELASLAEQTATEADDSSMSCP